MSSNCNHHSDPACSMPSDVQRTEFLLTRRGFLASQGLGIGAIACQWLMQQETAQAVPPILKKLTTPNDLKPRSSHYQPKAKAMISLFMHGGPSHVDLLDPKPELSKRHGQDYPGEVVYSFVNRANKKLLGSPWRFSKHGQSGTDVSELLPHFSEIVDDACVIRSMHTGFNGHEVSIRYFHSGIPAVTGRPTLGSWLVYALGSENMDLPAYMVLTDPGGHPVDGVHNWSNGFMPPLFQGTVLRAREPRILNLDPPPQLAGSLQQQNLQFLQTLNRRYLDSHPGEKDMEARIASFELAASMQTAAKEALDLSGESEATLRLYGIDQPHCSEYGKRCLIARRLIERGVRFVQLFLDGQPWDNHQSLKSSLPAVCKRTDQPTAALVKDLKDRGMLDSTLVHWGGEIGRLPVCEGDIGENSGRDHNGQGYSCWFAGGGIRGGTVYGATDEFGHRAVDNVVTPNDIQATILHLFGLDSQKLLYPLSGREVSLIDGRAARVVQEILA
jgi:hypothetical protein